MDNDKSRTQLYEKPRRIIHNQTLILLLIILVVAIPIPLAKATFELVFCVAPAVVIPSVLVAWAVGSVSYIATWLHVKRQNKKS